MELRSDYVEYRDIPGFPDYFAGDDGSIWSRKFGKIRKLKPILQNNGTTQVHLSHGTAVCVQCHVLIMLSFVGPRPKGMHIAHWDGDNSNNRLSNLRYATPVENEADKKRHGTRAMGQRHGMSKLDEEKVRSIRKMLSDGKTGISIARRFGVSACAVTMIKHGKVWKCTS